MPRCHHRSSIIAIAVSIKRAVEHSCTGLGTAGLSESCLLLEEQGVEIGDENRWRKRAVINEIAPVSFQDSNGDGKGDLAGLLQRVEYLQWLGLDAVWLTPIQKSPMRDFGYDIADYCAVDPAFGTMEDFDSELEALHSAGIRLILDMVPNHTSDEHPWF